MAGSRHRYRFVVLGRYQARTKGNESHVTLNVQAGTGDHLIYAGTLTMSDSEWEELHAALREALGDRLEVEEEHIGPQDSSRS